MAFGVTGYTEEAVTRFLIKERKLAVVQGRDYGGMHGKFFKHPKNQKMDVDSQTCSGLPKIAAPALPRYIKCFKMMNKMKGLFPLTHFRSFQ